jgi:hypothetical protein
VLIAEKRNWKARAFSCRGPDPRCCITGPLELLDAYGGTKSRAARIDKAQQLDLRFMHIAMMRIEAWDAYASESKSWQVATVHRSAVPDAVFGWN